MKRICIGIHVTEQPELLRATLESLRRNTSYPARLILLPDGPDRATKQALETLESLDHIQQLGTDKALGAPSCFNRLAAAGDADVLVLLESGAQVGPFWLDRLMTALAADRANGLAGPSTNRAWNEQGVFPRAGGTQAAVARTAREAERHFGSEVRSLAPLHSLSDFCYAVRREVIADIGVADEAYQTGPCWEMDYNIRAARAGWRGVWACGAYVHRAPIAANRRREEALRFEASKQRYQDKFCALRLRGERSDYELHCTGDECEHFAPASLIQVRMPFAIAPSGTASLTSSGLRGVQSETGHLGATAPTKSAAARVSVHLEPPTPMVSCVMATRDREAFVLQSIRYFERQDYPARELIIIDDGHQSLENKLPDDPRIRYLRLPRKHSIGAKRNLGSELARGSIIAQWDDDDYYAPERLSAQATPIISGEADITALKAGVFFDLPRWEFWRCTPELHRRLFVEDVHGGTLVYERRVWENLARYPDCSLAEDAGFLRQAIRRGARLKRALDQELFIYLRHATNSWSFNCGLFLDEHGWLRVCEPRLPEGDRAFYASLSAAAPTGADAKPSPACIVNNDGPLVSCIMPTYNRRIYVGRAIDYFLRQSYANSELIVVDDGDDGIDDMLPSDPRIRYIRLDTRLTIGAKRNLACDQARGELIVHWDDDDWMASRRLGYQVESMVQSGAELCGLDKPLFYDPRADRAWEYVYPRGGRFWVAGSTLCYTRSFWREHHFPNINIGEDTRFVWGARARGMLALEDSSFFVAIIHPGNTSVKRTGDARYQAKSPAEVRGLLGDDLGFYTSM